MVERDLINEDKYDIDRERYVKRIELESQFYSVFRNTVKILLNSYENKNIRDQIEGVLKSQYLLYKEKHEEINSKLKELLTEYVNFIEYDDDKLDKLIDVTRCIQNDDETCENRSYCMTAKTEGIEGKNICILLIPKKNLLTDSDNEVYYYKKMVDEMIRFGQIRMFLFKPKQYLSFDKVQYKLNQNEMLMMDSLLTPEYFDDIDIMESHKYITYHPFDTTQPNETMPYSRNVHINDLLKPVRKIVKPKLEEEACIELIKGVQTKKPSPELMKMLPKTTLEITFQNTPNCTFEMLLKYIINNVKDREARRKVIKEGEVRSILAKAYTDFLEKNEKSFFIDDK